jgi:hypothetical protein
MIRRLPDKVWAASREVVRIPWTVVLKLKTGDFTFSRGAIRPMLLRVRRTDEDCPVIARESNFREAEEMSVHPVLFDEGQLPILFISI